VLLSDRLFGGGAEREEELKAVIPRFLQLAPKEPVREIWSIVTEEDFFVLEKKIM
jgi:hypothetical protein